MPKSGYYHYFDDSWVVANSAHGFSKEHAIFTTLKEDGVIKFGTKPTW